MVDLFRSEFKVRRFYYLLLAIVLTLATSHVKATAIYYLQTGTATLPPDNTTPFYPSMGESYIYTVNLNADNNKAQLELLDVNSIPQRSIAMAVTPQGSRIYVLSNGEELNPGEWVSTLGYYNFSDQAYEELGQVRVFSDSTITGALFLGADFSPEGELYASSSITNSIHLIDLSDVRSIDLGKIWYNDQELSLNGGDLAFVDSNTFYLAIKNGDAPGSQIYRVKIEGNPRMVVEPLQAELVISTDRPISGLDTLLQGNQINLIYSEGSIGIEGNTVFGNSMNVISQNGENLGEFETYYDLDTPFKMTIGDMGTFISPAPICKNINPDPYPCVTSKLSFENVQGTYKLGEHISISLKENIEVECGRGVDLWIAIEYILGGKTCRTFFKQPSQYGIGEFVEEPVPFRKNIKSLNGIDHVVTIQHLEPESAGYYKLHAFLLQAGTEPAGVTWVTELASPVTSFLVTLLDNDVGLPLDRPLTGECP